MRIYVGNLSFNTEEQQLEQLFASIGDVASVRLVRDHATGQSRGFGFVEMADGAQGRAACDKLDQQEFEGRRLTVNEAKPQEQRSGGFSRGGGGGASAAANLAGKRTSAARAGSHLGPRVVPFSNSTTTRRCVGISRQVGTILPLTNTE